MFDFISSIFYQKQLSKENLGVKKSELEQSNFRNVVNMEDGKVMSEVLMTFDKTNISRLIKYKFSLHLFQLNPGSISYSRSSLCASTSL